MNELWRDFIKTDGVKFEEIPEYTLDEVMDLLLDKFHGTRSEVMAIIKSIIDHWEAFEWTDCYD